MLKCVVWDLDDTLWQGILKEKDVLHLPKERKMLIESIDRVGILQSIATRNEKQAAEQQLRDFGILEYFLYPQYGNHSKAVSIRKIAEALNIGLDSIAFVDDSEFEVAEVEYFLPEVRSYHVKSQWEEFLLLLEESDSTYESKNRRNLYLANALREKEALEFQGSREDFLKECRMVMVIHPALEGDIPRICELARRTNQFRTFSMGIDERLCGLYMEQNDKALYVAELSDRFGNYGIIGICFISIEEKTAVVEQFCISCRVEGRGAANAFLSTIVQWAMVTKKAERVHCRFMETDRNMPMLILLKALGFHGLPRQEGKIQMLQYEWIKRNPCKGINTLVPWIDIRFEGKSRG